MKTFKVTVVYEVEIRDEPSDEFKITHVLDAVLQAQHQSAEGSTRILPSMEFHATEMSWAFEELDC